MSGDWDTSMHDCARAVAERDISAHEIATLTIDRVERAEPDIQAFSFLDADGLYRQARAVDAKVAKGERLGQLAGVPLGVKELLDVDGQPTSYGSPAFEPYVATEDATCVRRLRGADALIVGKTRTHEFAYGGVTSLTANPADPSLIAGGSSGGSAASVAAGMVAGALGTDSGGSIRFPAACCCVVGLKPTFGVVSRTGALPASWSFDTVGPLARTVRDTRTLLEQLVAGDSTDGASADVRLIRRLSRRLHETKPATLRGLRLGVVDEPLFEIVDREAEDHYAETLQLLERLGVRLMRVRLPEVEFVMPALLAINLPEGAALHAERLRMRGDEFGDDVRRVLEIGNAIPAVLAVRGHQARHRIASRVAEIFRVERLEGLVTPATTGPPLRRDKLDDLVRRSDGKLESVLSTNGRSFGLANITGQPALVMPTVANQPQVGLQLIGKPFEDDVVLGIGLALEQEFSGGACRHGA